MSLIKRPPTLKMAPPGSHVVKRHAKISMKFSSFIMTLSIINLSLLPNKAESQIWTGVEEIKIDHETKLQMFKETNIACEIAGRSESID
jgi:hypothetical protein